MSDLQNSSLVEITTTVGNSADAERIAEALVEKRLSGCVQIAGPITSVYRWQGDVHRDQEWRCTIKTTAELMGQVIGFIKEIHPYETPEILCLPILFAHPDYERWLRESVTQ
jgi:periplasmic divalent cation tolerance protein